MARVYRAYHPQLDRYVAIKVMRSDLLDDGQLDAEPWRARFRREARAVASLRHPHIVQVYDFDVEDSVYYMVMELLEGDTLKARLNDYRARGTPMPRGEVVRVSLDVLDALAYAHSEGMIHRDVKPGNVLLTWQGEAVLTDFGIAQIVGGTRHTVTGALMGTLSYIAPEQGLEGQCDARGDLYSLGIVFYEMLTQRTPFDADTPLAILMKHLNDPLPLPRQVDPTIPESFERVTLKALAKRLDDRYQGAEEMAEALREATVAAGIELPPRVSVPAPRAAEAASQSLSDSVAIFSGKAREGIQDVEFADEATDPGLGQRLAVESASYAAASGLASSVVRDAAVGPAGKGTYPQLVDQLLGLDFPHIRDRPWVPIVTAVAVAGSVNLALIMFSGAAGLWAIWEVVWPIEMMLVGLVLCVVMYVAGTIWLLIPVGILVGNGLLFSYYTLTGKWEDWTFLWPLELFIVGGAVWFTLWLARYREVAQQLSHRLSWLLGLVATGWSMLIIVMAFVVALVARRTGG
jgi:serine/threonine protein kinase